MAANLTNDEARVLKLIRAGQEIYTNGGLRSYHTTRCQPAVLLLLHSKGLLQKLDTHEEIVSRLNTTPTGRKALAEWEAENAE